MTDQPPVQYGHALSCLDRFRRQGIGLDQAKQLLRNTCMQDGTYNYNASPIIHCSTEEAWVDDGRPTYRIAGPLSQALQSTDLDLDVKFVRFPHRAFAVELPLSGPGTIVSSGRRLQAIIIGSVNWPKDPYVRRVNVYEQGEQRVDWVHFWKCRVPEGGDDNWRICVIQCWEGEEDMDPPWFTAGMPAGETVASRIKIATEQPFRETKESALDHGVRPSQETSWKFMRLAFGAALFAVGAKQSFLREIPESRQRRRRRRKAIAHGRDPDLEDIEFRRWALGEAIHLPGDRRTQGEEGPIQRSRGELRWSHMRQGHLRMQRLGSTGEYRYELRYIKPTIVRDDLGFPDDYQATGHTLDQV